MSHPKFSDKLEATLSPYRDEFREVMNGWVGSGTFGLTYPAFLIETFHYVKHSCSLMSYACARLDRSHTALQTYLAKHIAEEVGHENWALNDLERLGYDRAMVEASPPMSETINLIGSQLYVINYLRPAGLFGYIYVMESHPPSKESLNLIEQTFNIPIQAMSFLTGHGESDQVHREELKVVLDTLLTQPEEREAAIISATLGLSNVNRMLSRIRAGGYTTWLPRPLSNGLSASQLPCSKAVGRSHPDTTSLSR